MQLYVISELDGRSNVVTLQTTATEILHDFYQNTRKTDSEKEKNRLIETAAKLILNDIKLIGTSSDNYPTYEEVKSCKKKSAFEHNHCNYY